MHMMKDKSGNEEIMKRTVIKGVIVACVFFMALFMANRLMNQENADMTMEMGEATYPVVTVDYNGYLINEMHGYARAMEVSQMRESITPLMEGRKIRLQIDTYGQKVSGISFEVRSGEILGVSGLVGGLWKIRRWRILSSRGIRFPYLLG